MYSADIFYSCHYGSSSQLFFFFFLMIRPPPRSTLFPYPPLFRSADAESCRVLRCDAQRVVERPPETALPDFFHQVHAHAQARQPLGLLGLIAAHADEADVARIQHRSEEHTSELQSQSNLVCRLLLEKKKKNQYERTNMQHVTRPTQ